MPLGAFGSTTLVLATTLVLTTSTATHTASLPAPASPAAVTAAPAAARQPVAAPAAPAPAAPPTLESVRAQVRALDAQVAAAAAAQARAEAQAAATKEQVRLTQIELAAAQARLDSATSRAGRMAAESYRRGAIDPTLVQVVLADDPDAVLTQATIVGRMHHRQALVVERTKDAARVVEEKRATLTTQLETLESATSAAQTARGQVVARRAAAAKLLGSLEEKQRRAVEAERRKAAAARQAATAARSTPAAASRSSARSSIAASSGSCASSGGRGAERGLSSNALRIMRCGLSAWPQVDRALGVGSRGNATDHDDGNAVDFMIPNYSSANGNDLGWAIAEWAAKQPGVSYVIFDQKIYSPGRGGWRGMENRGSDTANHRDHVHVSVN